MVHTDYHGLGVETCDLQRCCFFFRSHCLFVCLIKKQGHCCQLGNTHFRTFIFLIHWIDLQSQTKIVGILATNAVFFFASGPSPRPPEVGYRS